MYYLKLLEFLSKFGVGFGIRCKDLVRFDGKGSLNIKWYLKLENDDIV